MNNISAIRPSTVKITPGMYPQIPVVPGQIPVLGHVHYLITNPNKFYADLVHQVQPLAWVSHGFNKWSILVSGDAVDMLLKNKVCISGDVDATSADLLRNTVSTQDGTEHRRVRGAINGPFSPKGLNEANVVAHINEIFSAGIGMWPQGDSTKIGHDASQLTLQVIFRIIGVPASDLEDWGYHFKLASLGNFNLPQVPFTPGWKAARSIAWLGTRIRKLVDQAKSEEGKQQTLLTALVKSKDETGKYLRDDELVRNLRLLGFAGHETTAGVIAYMMTHYARNPTLWDRLLEEVKANADCDLSSTADLKRFPFAEAMFRESLRLNPPVSAIFRKLTEDVELHGHVLPKGCEVHISLASRSWDPVQYPNPRILNPDRWLERERGPGASESIQFGGGPHFCVGYHMAIVEGVWFAVYAARTLSESGLRPSFTGETKHATSPMNNLHRDTTLRFIPV